MGRAPWHFGYHIEVTQGFALSVMTLLLLLAVHPATPHIEGNGVVSEEG